MEQVKSTLYGLAKKGDIQQWKVYVDGNVVSVEYGKLNGKLQRKDTVCKGKNIGKSNETTEEEQAKLEAISKWNKQHERKQYRSTVEELSDIELRPVLAQDYLKHPSKVVFPCDVQPKLDGVRSLITCKNNEVVAKSRTGVEYHISDHLKHHIIYLNAASGIDTFDGELYIHGLKLQEILSAVKNEDSERHSKVEFRIFDVPNLEDTWGDRKLKLDQLKRYTESTNLCSFVHTDECLNKDHLDQFLTSFVNDGYEGLSSVTSRCFT